VLGGGLIGLAMMPVGCESPHGGRGPFSPKNAPDEVALPSVIAQVNENSAAMNFLLKGGGVTATGEYDKNGKRESFELKGSLLFRKPRELYMKLEHLAGKLEIGSNNNEFWVWEQLGQDRYYWGEHKNAKNVDESEMPIRPDHLLEVIGLDEIPTADGPNAPVPWIGPVRYELLFLDRDSTGRAHLDRTIDIDRKPPYFIREIVYFRPDGRPKMVAKLSEYRLVEGSKVLAPHLIKMRWLDNDSWMNLELNKMERFEKPSAESRFISPRQKGSHLGSEKRVDIPASTPPADATVKP
jgi:hypothetical protein